LFVFAPYEILRIIDGIPRASAFSSSTNNNEVVGPNGTNNTVGNFLTYANPTFGFKPSPVDNQAPQDTQRRQTISTLNFLTYRHPTLGFTIEYPEAPGLDVEEQGVGVSFPHSQGAYHVLVSGNIGKSLDEFASTLLQGKEEHYQDFKLIDQTSATVAGHPAIRTEYTFTGPDNGTPLHSLEYNVLFGGDGYILAFNTGYPTDAALDDFRAVVQKMLDSFQFPQSGSSVTNDNQQGETFPGVEGFGSSGPGGFGQEDGGEDGSDMFGQSPDEQDDPDKNGGFGSEGPQSPSEQDGEGGFNPFE
jgi:hypothetical protein